MGSTVRVKRFARGQGLQEGQEARWCWMGRLSPVDRLPSPVWCWGRSSAWLEHSTVTREVAGSSPVGPVVFLEFGWTKRLAEILTAGEVLLPWW